jgi:cyclase
MVRERIADDIYVFTSKRYAQVTAGAILTREGVILVDTLFYPDETEAIRDFLETRLGLRVSYVINTHYHADHSVGSYFFPEAQVVSHALCRQLLDTTGRAGLDQMKQSSAEFQEARVVLPELIFNRGALNLHLGGKTIRLIHFPGHSPDLIGVLVVNDRILFASDTLMAVPTIFDGSYDDLVRSLEMVREMGLDCAVQGHGEVILRGELRAAVGSDLAYLEMIKQKVADVVADGKPVSALSKIGIESCGKSRLPLNGFVSDLHQANLQKLYRDMTNGAGAPGPKPSAVANSRG